MTREEIIKLARGAGVLSAKLLHEFGADALCDSEIKDLQAVERLAQAAYAAGATAEREACLEIADQCADADMHASMAANAIRARG